MAGLLLAPGNRQFLQQGTAAVFRINNEDRCTEALLLLPVGEAVHNEQYRRVANLVQSATHRHKLILKDHMQLYKALASGIPAALVNCRAAMAASMALSVLPASMKWLMAASICF